MREHKVVITILLLFITIYLIQVFIIPPEAAALTKYHITATTARLLSLTFVVPLVAVWCTAVYGYLRLSKYAHSIGDTHGNALKKLSHGIAALALWLPISAVVQSASSDLRHRYPLLTEEVVIVTNLINIALLFVVSYLLWRGSRYLLRSASILPESINRNYLLLGTGFFGVIFSYSVLFNPSRISPPVNGAAAFYLPDWLLVPFVILPYIAIWYLGLEAVHNIHVYRNLAKGIIYKTALGYIANGIACSVVAALILRSLTAQTAWFDSLTLKFILMTIYALVFIIGIGYLLLLMGAKKLQLIEEV